MKKQIPRCARKGAGASLKLVTRLPRCHSCHPERRPAPRKRQGRVEGPFVQPRSRPSRNSSSCGRARLQSCRTSTTRRNGATHSAPGVHSCVDFACGYRRIINYISHPMSLPANPCPFKIFHITPYSSKILLPFRPHPLHSHRSPGGGVPRAAEHRPTQRRTASTLGTLLSRCVFDLSGLPLEKFPNLFYGSRGAAMG